MKRSLAAVSLLVGDYDEAISWFTAKLDFTVVANIHQGGGSRWVVVAPNLTAGARIVLAKAVQPAQIAILGNQAGGRVWLFFETDDFARDHRKFVDRGVRFIEPPRHEPYGTVAVFLDLYGNKWDLIQPA